MANVPRPRRLQFRSAFAFVVAFLRNVIGFVWKQARIIFLLFCVCVGIATVLSIFRSFRSLENQRVNCTSGYGVVDGNLTYLQLGLHDQHPTEPYFNSDLFLNLGNAYGKNPVRVSFTVSGSRGYGANLRYLDLNYDEFNHTLWAGKPVDTGFDRVSLSHRYFPFDSAKFDFDVTYTPAVPINNISVRNFNPSFVLACDTYVVERKAPNVLHISFEARRNPLVQTTSVVLIIAGFLFLIGIIFFVKRENLPTSIASFFFSLWSIRAILASEMKTFPTVLDLAILSLCVLLLVSLGIRIGLRKNTTTEEIKG